MDRHGSPWIAMDRHGSPWIAVALFLRAPIRRRFLTRDHPRLTLGVMRFFRLLSFLALTPTILLTACTGVSETGDDTGSAGNGAGTGVGTGGGAGGGGSTTTTTTPTEPAAEPIAAPKEEWTWVGFDNAFCANGSTTGIGANLTDKSSKVVIYLMGGGACWNDVTCYQAKTAVNIESGYDKSQFDKDADFLNGSLFDRADPNNALKDASFFFVPYCTGDVHSGANPDAVYGGTKTKHVGYENMQAYLARIVATFPNAERVLLSGSSAGGFGAGLNWWATQQAFGDTRVDLINDSGPPLPAPYLSDSLEGQWRAAWNLNATLPEGCPECQTDLSAIFGFYAASLPKNRAALLSYTHDAVISSYFGISQDQMAEGLGVLSKSLDTYSNSRYFYVAGGDHVLLGDPAVINQNGVVLQDWLTQMLADDGTWSNVKP